MSDSPTEELGILHERVFLKTADVAAQESRFVFPDLVDGPGTLLHKTKAKWQAVVSKNTNGIDQFESEVPSKPNGGSYIFKLGRRKSALGNLPPDETQFPSASWLKGLLADGVQSVRLDSVALSRPSPPNRRPGLRANGAGLPWLLHECITIRNINKWIRHVRTSVPDLVAVSPMMRPEDRHRYLMLEYENGIRVPSWMASDGTLRMLALTLPAYLTDNRGIYLIEEPENGIHPKAIETVFQSLSSLYDAQLLMASHSPVVLGCAPPDVVLCFAKNEDGATDIVTGMNHLRLQEWKDETNLGQLFAAGVLG